MIGLPALLFASLADRAGELFLAMTKRNRWLPFALTPAGFAASVWLTRRLAPEAAGSGIPQVMAGARDPVHGIDRLVAAKTVALKFVLTIGMLLVGASVGREEPTVQISAAIMDYSHRLMAISLRTSVYIAGGAAGVAAAFNTPLAGVAFAIEELAAPMSKV